MGRAGWGVGTGRAPTGPPPPAKANTALPLSPCTATCFPSCEPQPSGQMQGEVWLLSPLVACGPLSLAQLALEAQGHGQIPTGATPWATTLSCPMASRATSANPGDTTRYTCPFTSAGDESSGGCAPSSAAFEKEKSLFSGEKLSACGTEDGEKLASGDKPECPEAALLLASLTGAVLQEEGGVS